MNKTRMGKRAASLLLSLVMMLSLLPTAAYAAMADGVDTQGAIVSGNGTDVSDDSNSSGGTGDLQVEERENSGTPATSRSEAAAAAARRMIPPVLRAAPIPPVLRAETIPHRSLPAIESR